MDEKPPVDDFDDLVDWALGSDRQMIDQAINTALNKHSIKTSKQHHARELILTAFNEIKLMQQLYVHERTENEVRFKNNINDGLS